MTLDITKPVQTRDGRQVEIYSRNDTSFVAFVQGRDSPDQYTLRTYYNNGSYSSYHACGDDIINCPPTKVKKAGWVVIWPTSKFYGGNPEKIKHTSGVFSTYNAAVDVAMRAKAMSIGLGDRYSIVKIEWEEEQ